MEGAHYHVECSLTEEYIHLVCSPVQGAHLNTYSVEVGVHGKISLYIRVNKEKSTTDRSSYPIDLIVMTFRDPLTIDFFEIQ